MSFVDTTIEPIKDKEYLQAKNDYIECVEGRFN